MNAVTQQNPTNTIIRKFAEHYDLPVMGVTNMGGKPYVNSAGLMAKAKQIGLKSIKIDIEKAAVKDDLSAIVKATVKLKDGSEYEDYGYGSKESIKMSTLHNPDFITMTTITRAKNRALRSATGFGMVSIEELIVADGMYSSGGSESVDLENTNLVSLGQSEEIKTTINLGELKPKEAKKKKEEIIVTPPLASPFYDEMSDVVEMVEEVFGTEKNNPPIFGHVLQVEPPVINPDKEPMKPFAEFAAGPPKTHKEKMLEILLKELEQKPNFNPEPILNHFMVSSVSDLLEGQVEFAIKWVRNESLPLVL